MGALIMWYKFDSLEHFETWHNQIKTQLGIPMDDGITVNYTELMTRANGELFAYVDEPYAEGLTLTNRPDPVLL